MDAVGGCRWAGGDGLQHGRSVAQVQQKLRRWVAGQLEVEAAVAELSGQPPPVVQDGIVKVSSGSLRSTLWFAPTLGNWVRFESEILNSDGGLEAKVSQELVRLDRRADN